MLCHLEILKSLRVDKTGIAEILNIAEKNKISDEKIKEIKSFILEIETEEAFSK